MEHLRLAALGIIHNSHLNQATFHQLTKEVILNKNFRPQTSTVMNTKHLHVIQTWVIRENVFKFFVKFIFVT